MRGHILLADPAINRRIMTLSILRRDHFTVEQVNTVAEAVQAAAKKAFDFIVAAERLPDGTASDLVGAGHPPVIALLQPGAMSDTGALHARGVAAVIPSDRIGTLLVAWLCNMARSGAAVREWQTHDAVVKSIGLAERAAQFTPRMPARAVFNVAVVSPSDADLGDFCTTLSKASDLNAAQFTPTECWAPPDGAPRPDGYLVIAKIASDLRDATKLVTALHSHDLTRHAATLAVNTCDLPEDHLAAWAADILDKGISDVVVTNVTNAELTTRTRRALNRKRRQDLLRATAHDRVADSIRDPLTGLFNRRYINEHLGIGLKAAVRARQPFSVLLADIDHFKRVNDTYLHTAGDAVIVETAQRMRRRLRDTDVLGRFGGEEFLAVMSGANYAQAKRAAKRIRHAIRQTPFDLPNDAGAIDVTISIGVAVFDPHDLNHGDAPPLASSLIDQADRSLYAAKANGRDCVQLSRVAA